MAVATIRGGFVLIDGSGAELWAGTSIDTRVGAAISSMRQIDSDFDAEAYRVTGQPAVLMALPRLVWLRDHQPEVVRRAERLLLLPDWLNYRMTGVCASDPATASTAGLIDLRTRRWHDSSLKQWGLATDLLCPLTEPGSIVGLISPQAASSVGLRPGTPVVVAGPDTQLAVAGSCLGAGSNVAAVVGGSHWQQAITRTSPLDSARRTRSACAVVPPRIHVETISLFAGLAMSWLLDLFELSSPRASALINQAGLLPPRLIANVSTPMNATEWHQPVASVSGMQFGPDATDRAAMMRAMLDQAALATVANLDILAGESGAQIAELFFTAGASRSATWAQILADATALPVRRPIEHGATLRGTAAVAAAGIGWFGSIEEATEAFRLAETVTEPTQSGIDRYGPLVEAWLEIDRTNRQLARSGQLPAVWVNSDIEQARRGRPTA